MLPGMAGGLFRIAGMALGVAAISALLLAERAAPLRQRTRKQAPRISRNIAMGAACQAAIMVSEAPLSNAVARYNARGGRGLQHRLGGGWAGRAAAFLAMDYGFYLWHVATHKVPFLWRFHRVHHVDADLDASTAIRFHFLDMIVSTPWRLVQVRLSGIDRPALDAWRLFFLGSILFHHSNWRLPGRLDALLSQLITTPRMHGIHHSQVLAEMDSNWTSGIALWDHLHGTFRDRPAQHAITIGVDDTRAAHDEALLPALAAPFRTPPAGGRIEGA